MNKDYSKEVVGLIKKYKNNSWQFGKPQEVIAHDFSEKLTYEDIKELIIGIKSPEFTSRENRNGENISVDDRFEYYWKIDYYHND